MSDVKISPAWKIENPEFRRDAIAFWDRLGIIPEDQSTESRAANLCAVAYEDARLIAVSTASIVRYKPLRATLALFRAAVDPDRRQMDMARNITRESIAYLRSWSAEHPAAKLAGVMTIYESDEFYKRPRPGVSDLGNMLFGYTDTDLKMVINWFDHTRI